MESSNPAYSIFEKLETLERPTEATMSINGTVTKTFGLVALALLTAMMTFTMADPALIVPSLFVSTIVAFTVIFKPQLAPWLAPIYAVAEGVGLGVLSSMFELRYPGIAVHAMMGTFGTLGMMLLLYRAGAITYSAKFASIMSGIMAGICSIYLIDLAMSFFFSRPISFVHDATPIGIAFSVGVVIVAALNFIGDFDMVEKGVKERAPKYMEWYCAFAMLVTVVWLYLEILRLLAKLQERDRD